jgi:hypothetical protein
MAAMWRGEMDKSAAFTSHTCCVSNHTSGSTSGPVPYLHSCHQDLRLQPCNAYQTVGVVHLMCLVSAKSACRQQLLTS